MDHTKEELDHGDVFSIGYSRCGKIQVEYIDVMCEANTSYILLDKEDCELIKILSQKLG